MIPEMHTMPKTTNTASVLYLKNILFFFVHSIINLEKIFLIQLIFFKVVHFKATSELVISVLNAIKRLI